MQGLSLIKQEKILSACKRNRKMTYTQLSYEDRLLIEQLFEEAERIRDERELVRGTILKVEKYLAELRNKENVMTKEIMNLTKGKIANKFDVSFYSIRRMKQAEKDDPNYSPDLRRKRKSSFEIPEFINERV